MGEVISADGKEPGGVTNRLHEQCGYLYDAAGNLNARTNNALVEVFNVNSLNELTTETNIGTLTAAGTTTSHATSTKVNGLTATNYVDNTFAKDGFTIPNGINTFTAKNMDMWDDPSVSGITGYNLVEYVFRADSRVKCLEGEDKGKIYGGVFWGFDISTFGASKWLSKVGPMVW